MAMAGLEFIEDVLITLLNAAIDQNTVLLFLNVCDALRKFIDLSPYHAETVRAILRRVKSIAKARAALYPTSVAYRTSPEVALLGKLDSLLQPNS